jgi:hypothetical protein
LQPEIFDRHRLGVSTDSKDYQLKPINLKLESTLVAPKNFIAVRPHGNSKMFKYSSLRVTLDQHHFHLDEEPWGAISAKFIRFKELTHE